MRWKFCVWWNTGGDIKGLGLAYDYNKYSNWITIKRLAIILIQERRELQENLDDFSGRWLGGLSLIMALILLVISFLLRIQFQFFFTDQLAAYSTHPNPMLMSYSFLIRMILLFLAVLTLVQLNSIKKPLLGLWGGLLIIGLFARVFHSGADHFAFQIIKSTNVEVSTQLVDDFYGMFHIVHILNFSILFDWIVLKFLGCSIRLLWDQCLH